MTKFKLLLVFGVINLYLLNFASSQAVNFTLHGNHLLEALLSESKSEFTIEDIYSHGCWCNFLRISEKASFIKRGHPIDPIDQICRSYSQCFRCVKIEGYCELSKKHYFVFQKKKSPKSCDFPQADFCSRERCDCDLNAALAIQKYLKMHPNWKPSPKEQVDSHCGASKGIPGVKKNRCCKEQGIWLQFNNNTHWCDWDNAKLKEGQNHETGRSANIEESSNGEEEAYNNELNTEMASTILPDFEDVESQIVPNLA